MHPLHFINRVIAQVGDGWSRGTVNFVTKEGVGYTDLSDDELQQLLSRATAGNFKISSSMRLTWFDRSLLSCMAFFGRTRFQHDLNSLVSLGVEAFRRAPADLPVGSVLYAEQILAASALTNQTAVEMETGEGKTYAILPAAFALACRFHQVYVICANEYLAWRDARRTMNFWEFVGLPVGLGIETTPISEWGKRVVYTTLKRLIFKELTDSTLPTPPQYPLTYGAAILDEIDAILLDQSATPYSLTMGLESEAYDWSMALELCDYLEEGKTIIVDRVTLEASLTQEGENLIREHIGAQSQEVTHYLVVRKSVELSFIASKVVREDIDYVIENNHAYSIDRTSGRIDQNTTPDWLPVLEVFRGLAGRIHTVDLNTLRAITFFQKFSHLTGTSGTVLEDSLEFFLSHRLLSLRIKPRFQRMGPLETDLVFASKGDALRAAVERVVKKVSKGQPVIIGTQTIADAETLELLLQKSIPDGVRLNLLTGRDDAKASAIFEAAGQVNNVLVTTQLAGRGVDIRLSDEARANGGLDLISISHALQSRHDRQFLGRAGRHGDPFSAIFICSLDDELLNMVGGEKIAKLMNKLGLEEGEAIEHRLINRAIEGAQRQYAYHQFLQRRSAELHSFGEQEAYSSAMYWFAQLQSSSCESKVTDIDVSEGFIEFAVDRFLRANVDVIIQDVEDVNREKAESLKQIVLANLDVPKEWGIVRVRDLEGRSGKMAREVLRIGILRGLNHVMALHRLVWSALQINCRLYHKVLSHKNLFIKAQELLECEMSAEPVSRGSGVQSKSKVVSTSDEDSLAVKMKSSKVSHVGNFMTDEELLADFKISSPRDVWRANLMAAISEIEPMIGELRITMENLPESFREGHPSLEMVTGAFELLERMKIRAAEDLPDSDTMLLDDVQENRALIMDMERFLYQNEKLNMIRERLLDRNLRSISLWIVKLNWLEFLQEKERLRFRYAQQNLRFYEYYQLISTREEQAWCHAENGLPARLLSSLFRSHYPHMLDKIFLLNDHRKLAEMPEPQTFEWKAFKEKIQDSEEAPSDSVDLFIALHEDQLDSTFNRSHLLRLLDDFLQDHPMYTLNTAAAIQRALESWLVTESERGVSSSKKKIRKQWIRKYILFLHSRGLVGPLPQIREKLSSIGRRLSCRLTNLRTLIPTTFGMLFSILFVLLSWKGGFLPKTHLTATLIHLDAWVTGGLIAAGNLLAPAVGGLFVAALVRFFLKSQLTYRDIGENPIERFLATIMSLIIAFSMTWLGSQSFGGFSHFALQLILFLAMMLLAVLITRIVRLIRLETSIDLFATWLCYCGLVVIPPLVAREHEIPIYWFFVPFFAAIAFVWQRLNVEEVELVSAHIKQTVNPQYAEIVTTPLRVIGSAGYAPFVFALTLTWVVAEWNLVDWVLQWLSIKNPELISGLALYALYWSAAACWSVPMLSKQFDVSLWKRRLNQQRQLIKGIDSSEEIERYLHMLRRSFVVRELIWSAFLILSVLLLLGVGQGYQAPVPLGLILVTAGLMVGSELPAFIMQLRNYLIGSGIPAIEVLNIQSLPEPEETLSFWQSLRRAVQHRLAITLTLLVILLKVLQFFGELWKHLVSN